MNIITFILVLVAVFVIALGLMGLKIVQQSETMVVERLGKYNRTLSSGINIIWPFIDKPRQIMWRYVKEDLNGKSIIERRGRNRIDLRETVYDFPRQSVITKDNVITEINAILYFQIIDPVKSIYEIENLPDAIEKLTQTTLRNVVGEMDLDETLSSRDTINTKLRSVLDDATGKWGVKVNRVELQDINPPENIRDAMEKQMRAERDKRANILTAEGRKAQLLLESEGEKDAEINRAISEKQAQILRAEGEAQARLKIAEAEAEAIAKITQAISTKTNPENYLIAVRYIETLKEMVSGKDNKVVYLPYEATGILSSIGGIKDMLGGK
ncbi:SPFH/Band 7/PHB domain protein [Bacteroidales bacterium OttesenSCG-928-B11]|nr:SPFH/Band 7/PHB domain protein [Bacteroidales bacterium OttesenSCG-928-C03]MDL2311780.1 SPFH/Band 7/PHB domain protein [Bacteroidales bacterium OttesenSCG-928-B11]